LNNNKKGDDDMHSIDDSKLEKVAGGSNVVASSVSKLPTVGMPNPASKLTYKEADEYSDKLGLKRTDMGGWMRMSKSDFMRWWRDCHKDSKEYLDHKEAVDKLVDSGENTLG
jgi:hypothetical protein